MDHDKVKLKREIELEILKIVNSWTKNADNKANFLLLINLAILGYFLSILFPSLKLNNFKIAFPIIDCLLITLIIFLTLSFYFLYRTIRPNIESVEMNKKSPIYFGAIANMNFESFVNRVSDLYNEDSQEVLKQVYINSQIVKFKFKYVKNGYLFAFLSLFISVIIILLI